MIFVDHKDKLAPLMQELNHSSWVCVDTEADSMHHFYEKLCLLQLSTANEDFVIDTLRDVDMPTIAGLISEKNLYLHGADFDVRILKKHTQGIFKPKKIFDTMIAAQIIGKAKIGLSDLARDICGVELAKKYQTADWSRRPLADELLDYASNDTRHLKKIADHLMDELKQLGRHTWHEESCHKLLMSLENAHAPKAVDPLEWQIKGSKLLSGWALTFLKRLWYWRQQKAKELDRPPFKVLSSDYLLSLSQYCGDLTAKGLAMDIAQADNAPRHVRGEFAQELNALLADAVSAGPTLWQREQNPEDYLRLTSHQGQILKDYKIKREEVGKLLNIPASLIINNAQLEKVVLMRLDTPDKIKECDFLMKWQTSLLSEHLFKAHRAGS